MIELTQDQIDSVVVDDLKNLMQQLWTDQLKDTYLYDAVTDVLSYYITSTEYEEFMESLKGN